ncbi:tyrosinase co-factor MelC1 [Saccharothrix saharensis]|uniref:Tyrosinase co-factor MelC1 n=1 Tax=Saccharothrix saharensis TaxID=571190 RepID=A0A543J4V0_9PSEU|nr:tyrosinase family oxidase copper chaperone [Saccharothrix saharensis]TQM77860.1 tyrosinase co-factor MelC1 [Saccharothrix saharensis]
MNDLSRRDVFRHGAAAALIAVTATGLAGLASSGATAGPNRAAAQADPRDFEENYKGKKIKGEHDKERGKHKVHINGRKLGVVQVRLPVAPDSTETYLAVLSTLNHFDPIPLDEGDNRDGLKKLARLAVDQLGDQELTRDADHEHP